MSLDPRVGDFPQADVLVEGKKILAVGPNLRAGGADDDRRERPHRHARASSIRTTTSSRRHCAASSPTGLIKTARARRAADIDYFEYILQKFAPVYRPQDVYINELFSGLSQLDDGVTTVHDISQIHHSPAHSDAAIQGLIDAGAAPPSAISRARAALPATSIRPTRSASRSSGSPRTTSSSR